MSAMITGAAYNPENKFNVFNITKTLQSGLVLYGSDKKIMLMKDDKKIKFDVVIPMSHGALYACFFV